MGFCLINCVKFSPKALAMTGAFLFEIVIDVSPFIVA